MKTNHPTPDNIEFKEVTPDNWRIINSLSVKKEQKNFAASNVTILARAFVYRKENAKGYEERFINQQLRCSALRLLI